MENRRVAMSANELKKLRVIWDVLAKKTTQHEAGKTLGLTSRQIRRLCKKVSKQGEKGVIHGLVQMPSNNLLPLSSRSSIISLWNNKYKAADLNYSHFTEKLNEVELIKVSRECVRNLLIKEGLVTRSKKKISKHRKKRERKLCFGEMIQLDTSPHDWLSNGMQLHMVVAIDDATSTILYLKIYQHDGTMANMEAMKTIMEKQGLPKSFYVDGAAWFTTTRNGNGSINIPDPGKVYQTQIERALEELGIELIIAGSAQAKGRVERANRTLQDRLISELILSGTTSIDAANEFIEKVFIPDHNKRFSIEAQSPSSAFVTLINNDLLNDIFCLKLTSTVRNDNTISKKNKYQIQVLPTDRRLNWSRAKVEVRIHLDGSVNVYHLESGEKLPILVKELKIPTEFKHHKIRISYEEDIFTLQKADISI